MDQNGRGFIAQLEVICVADEELVLSPRTFAEVRYAHKDLGNRILLVSWFW